LMEGLRKHCPGIIIQLSTGGRSGAGRERGGMIALGGHCRTGLEDNVRIDRDTLAISNAALVKRVVDICHEYGRRPATVHEARTRLGLIL
jgi:uncharacterized protein (DUF849 family)